MDAKVFYEGSGIWHVNASPSMRSLGAVLEQPDLTVIIEPDEGSNLAGVAIGPHQSLQDAMNVIAVHLGGDCGYARRKRFSWSARGA